MLLGAVCQKKILILRKERRAMANLKIDAGAFTVSQGQYPLVIVSPAAVSNPKLMVRGKPIAFNAMAQWDTGATHNLISPSLAKKAGLKRLKDSIRVNAAGSSFDGEMCEGSLMLPHGIVAEDQVFIIDKNLEGTDIDLVIGLAVINCCDFALSHDEEGNVVLSVAAPPSMYVDFVSNKV